MTNSLKNNKIKDSVKHWNCTGQNLARKKKWRVSIQKTKLCSNVVMKFNLLKILYSDCES